MPRRARPRGAKPVDDRLQRAMTLRRLALLSLVVAAVLGAGALIWRTAQAPQGAEPSAVGGPFHLIDQTGAPVDERILKGRLSAVFFGYTYCPDVCPTTLANLGQAVALLGADGRRLQVVFITIDPERDTPKALAAYLSSPTFPPGVRGLTGDAAQIAVVAKAYRVYYQKVPQGSSYSMDHSAVVYLMDASGAFLRPLDTTVAPPKIADQIRVALAGG